MVLKKIIPFKKDYSNQDVSHQGVLKRYILTLAAHERCQFLFLIFLVVFGL